MIINLSNFNTCWALNYLDFKALHLTHMFQMRILYFLPVSIFLLIEMSSAQTGQDYKVELHQEFKTDDREIPEQYVGSNDDGHYFLYSKGKYGYGASSLVKFNNNFLPTNEEIQLTQGSDDKEVEEHSLGIIELDDKLLCITTKSTKNYRKFFAKTVDLETFQISSQKEISNISIEGTNMRKSFMSFVLARDNSSVGLFYSVPTKSKVSKKYSLIVFDKEFNQLDKFDYEFPHGDREFVIMNGILLNKEEMIVLTANLSNIPTSPNSRKVPNYEYTITSLNKGKSELVGKVPNDFKWLNKLNLVIDEASIKLIGLYSNVGRYDVHGTFFHKIDRFNHNNVVHQLIPFNQKLLDQHYEISMTGNLIKKKIKKYRELPYYITKNTLSYDDGSILLLAEQTHTYTQYVTTYHSQNVVALLIDDNGTVEWSKMIKKDNSKTSTWVYSSYIVGKNQDDYILVYNGSKKNLNPNDTKRYKAFFDKDHESLLVVELKKNGRIKQESVTSKAISLGYRVRPGLSSKIGEDRILLFAQRPSNVRNQRFMTLNMGKSDARSQLK